MCTTGHPHISSHRPLKTSSHPAVHIHVSPILTCCIAENLGSSLPRHLSGTCCTRSKRLSTGDAFLRAATAETWSHEAFVSKSPALLEGLGEFILEEPTVPVLANQDDARSSEIGSCIHAGEQSQWNDMLELCFHTVVVHLGGGPSQRCKAVRNVFVRVRRAEQSKREASRSRVWLSFWTHTLRRGHGHF